MVVLRGHSQAGQVPVRAVGHERLVVPVFGRIGAPGRFLCIPVPGKADKRRRGGSHRPIAAPATSPVLSAQAG